MPRRRKPGLHNVHERIHIWLIGWPVSACGVRVDYSNGDDEWWTGHAVEGACPKCLSIIGFARTHPTKIPPVIPPGHPMQKIKRRPQ